MTVPIGLCNRLYYPVVTIGQGFSEKSTCIQLQSHENAQLPSVKNICKKKTGCVILFFEKQNDTAGPEVTLPRLISSATSTRVPALTAF